VDTVRDAFRDAFRDEHERWCVTCPGSRFSFTDETLTCRRCRTAFVFSAEQQRHWYVDLGLIEAAKPPRLCGACGRHRRTGRTSQNRLTAAVLAVRRRPDDVMALLDLAAAVADHVGHTGRGSAAQGVTAARRARALAPSSPESWYWEAVCHDVAGRPSRAVECYRRFVASAGPVRRLRRLVGRAAHRAHELGALPGAGVGTGPGPIVGSRDHARTAWRRQGSTGGA
jgi:hypothetical protein